MPGFLHRRRGRRDLDRAGEAGRQDLLPRPQHRLLPGGLRVDRDRHGAPATAGRGGVRHVAGRRDAAAGGDDLGGCGHGDGGRRRDLHGERGPGAGLRPSGERGGCAGDGRGGQPGRRSAVRHGDDPGGPELGGVDGGDAVGRRGAGRRRGGGPGPVGLRLPSGRADQGSGGADRRRRRHGGRRRRARADVRDDTDRAAGRDHCADRGSEGAYRALQGAQPRGRHPRLDPDPGPAGRPHRDERRGHRGVAGAVAPVWLAGRHPDAAEGAGGSGRAGGGAAAAARDHACGDDRGGHGFGDGRRDRGLHAHGDAAAPGGPDGDRRRGGHGRLRHRRREPGGDDTAGGQRHADPADDRRYYGRAGRLGHGGGGGRRRLHGGLLRVGDGRRARRRRAAARGHDCRGGVAGDRGRGCGLHPHGEPAPGIAASGERDGGREWRLRHRRREPDGHHSHGRQLHADAGDGRRHCGRAGWLGHGDGERRRRLHGGLLRIGDGLGAGRRPAAARGVDYGRCGFRNGGRRGVVHADRRPRAPMRT